MNLLQQLEAEQVEKLAGERPVPPFQPGDTLEIARPEGPPVVVPFTRAVVPSVDLAAGRLVVDPPPGLLDEPERARPGREKETA